MPPFPWVDPQQPDTRIDGNSGSTPSTSTQPVSTPSTSTELVMTPSEETGADITGEDSERESVAESEVVTLHVEDDEYKEFDPKLKDEESWQAPASMASFLEKHFNQSLEIKEREAILSDFPKPQCDVLQVPKLDPEVREQLTKKGKDPQFGTEKVLYKIQQQLLEVTGPLTCLWSDLIGPGDRPNNEQIVQLLQSALVLVGSASHNISVERRKLAWGRINPNLKTLATETYNNRKGNLFGPGFLEKASKKVDADKALAKVVSEGSNPRKRQFEEDPKDLRRFLSRGAPVQYGSKGKQRHFKPYNAYPKKPYQNKKQQRK